MKLQLPPGAFDAYLFDCDGTIVDSMPLHYIAWKKTLEEWNCEFDEKLFYAWGGMPILEIISTLNRDRGLHMPVEQVALRKESLYFELLPQLKVVPEVLEHIEMKHGEIPFAVVSGSALDSVTASLSQLNLLDRFDALVCAGDYQKSKPDPEAFLLLESRTEKGNARWRFAFAAACGWELHGEHREREVWFLKNWHRQDDNERVYNFVGPWAVDAKLLPPKMKIGNAR